MVSAEEYEEGNHHTMSTESPSRHVTVVDVYDLASVIGKDFEKLIDRFGSDVMTSLMPKVISALEMLEMFANRNERENEEIAVLKTTVQRLEDDKEQRMEGRKKFDRELEQIEENYRNEIKQLWDMVQRLQEENKRLNNALEVKDQSSPTYAIKEDDLAMMLTLKETVDHQREHAKQADLDFRVKQEELESTHLQLEKLQRVNKELTRKNNAVQNQGRELVEEKAELISILQSRDCEIELLKFQLGETEKARKDLEETKDGSKKPNESVGGILSDLQQAVQSKLTLSMAAACAKFNAAKTLTLEQEFDRGGDNVPRFTLAELREMLQEKNWLKARVMELEEELAQLRPPRVPSPQPPETSKPEEEEIVVYGPINKEPDEKLYPWRFGRRDSGVRKFFNRIWPSPRRSIQASTTNYDGVHSTDGATPVSTGSSASSSRTRAIPTVHYHNVDHNSNNASIGTVTTSWPFHRSKHQPSPRPPRPHQHRRDNSDSSGIRSPPHSVSSSSPASTSNGNLSLSSLLSRKNEEDDDLALFDGAYMAEEFGESSR